MTSTSTRPSPLDLWIGGAGRAAAGGRRLEVIDPGNLEVVGDVADASAADATAAVDAAVQAFDAWSRRPPRERSDVLRRAHELMLAEEAGLPVTIATENGKALADARSEVRYAAEFFLWFSEEAVRTEGDYAVAPTGGARTLVSHKPLGVAVLARAGAPGGVVNVVPTTDAEPVVARMLAYARVRKLSVTGSTGWENVAGDGCRTGAELLDGAGWQRPACRGRGADLQSAVDGAMTAKFRNGGQACTAANRLYVHRERADEFLAAFGRGWASSASVTRWPATPTSARSSQPRLGASCKRP